MSTTFTFVPARDRPVWSTAPLCTRMVSPYRDRAGQVHIFADSFDPSEPGRFQDRLSSWAAVQRYYSTADFERFDDHGVVVGRGHWSGDPATSDADCVGAGSPGVTVAGDQVLLFYAGRGPADPAGPFEHSMNRADLPGQIMLAIAPADANGAPAGPFVKQGTVTDYGAPWRSIRHDDPRPVVTGDEILLFFKGIGPGDAPGIGPGDAPGIGPGDAYANRVIGLARTPIDRPVGPYTIHPEPVLRSERGCESPRVFRVGDEWHMFVLRYSTPGRPGMRRYGHYRGEGPFHWELVNDDAYVTTSDRPGVGAADMCPVWTPFEDGPPRLALANRIDDGTFGDPGLFKQWLWEIREVPTGADA